MVWNAQKEEINEYCQKLPRYKRPKKVIFAEVPRNATGKIEKPALERNMVPSIWLHSRIWPNRRYNKTIRGTPWEWGNAAL